MEWIPIDRNNLPGTEVLVTLILPNGAWSGNYWLGYVYCDDKTGPYSYNDRDTATMVTHYFDPENLKIPQNEIKLGERT